MQIHIEGTQLQVSPHRPPNSLSRVATWMLRAGPLTLTRRSQVDRAKDYIGYVMQQRVGPKVTVDATKFREDLSIVDVPEVKPPCPPPLP